MDPPVALHEPLDMIRLNLDEVIYLKCKNGRELVGRLHAFDEHCNMVLSDVTETITTVDADDNSKNETTKVTKRDNGTIFVRGDSLVLLSHYDKT
ncbi:u6 snrna-associated sm-like protein Lsm3, putative [Theileria annulata]|uniref:U6 snrna-associated sm-like protein Lsm3, putative n=1 Tax=Theileria annulata TaxID=5874 RepID=Q4UDG7_THEAN|nr:u6 snrna-associated sm-like protein Lsm3, putative [Theileria annulata]CAI74872.1 u6 snrna-associated sm-like protein Lsm3, putative [Theileria annulata]|eukprot:XP_952604.1 u6 snrna-associated sm-like protein Lsm3, putative [Theileria annulata]